MKSDSLHIHPAFIPLISVAAPRKSAAFSTRNVSGALTRRRYSELEIPGPIEKCRLAREGSSLVDLPGSFQKLRPCRDAMASPRTAGFTLIELLVVIAIIAILAG